MNRVVHMLPWLVLLTLAACESAPPEVPAEGAEAGETEQAPSLEGESRFRRAPGLDYIFYPDEPMRPAYRTGPLATSGKADQYDDTRGSAPQRYAITVPPPAGVRGMVEWEPMQALVMATPTYMMSYDNASHTIIQIAKHASTVAEVWFITESSNGVASIKARLLNAGVSQATIDQKFRFLVQPIDSIWFIDSGPLPLIDEASDTFALTDFRYYHNRPLDDGIPTWLGRQAEALGLDTPVTTYRMPLNTEGGTYQTTSDGICFTGNRQLWNMSCADGACDPDVRFLPLDEVQQHPLAVEIRQVWKEYAGCKDVVITNSITDDGTGHIDMYMKIVDDDTIIMGEYEQPYQAGFEDIQATNGARLDANAAFLESYVKPGGGTFEVKRIVMPGHRSTNNGGVPFTYINSTFVNGVNLWPAFTFPEWEDSRAKAQAQWEAIMPDYEHIWIDSEELSYWSGAIHCITRTIPARTPGLWVADGACADGTCQAPEGGYDGACFPSGVAQEVCWGPAWECACNDCDSGCGGGTPSDCGGVTYTGCCGGSTLQYCDGGNLQTQSCQSSCGWDADKGWYDCGGAGADPSGEFPLECGGCTPSCSGKACGDDGCGGSCGTCADGEVCSGGTCAAGCGDITYEGCCDGTDTIWCEDGVLKSEPCGGDGCGWLPNQGYYYCGGSGADASGEFPLECGGATCQPDCAGKACGDDGCGGSCGNCGAGETCGAGACEPVPCEPDCAGKACGDDGCGGSCGICGAGEACEAGACEAIPCEPDCAGKACGDDGCGGSCGTCSDGQTCHAGGVCKDEPCTPDCSGKQCGGDGCGGTCGTCAGDSACEAGVCVPQGCTPDCAGKACGDDGCGGSCGTCADGEVCEAGACEPQGCVPDCVGKQCGADGCGGVCGQCGSGLTCNAQGACEAVPCDPDCTGTQCGDDGCGGSCGACADGEACQAGQCQAVEGCGDVTFEGTCDGATVVWCEEGQVKSFDCTEVGKVCGLGEDTGHTCVEACVPDCSGKQCGDDGCGGACGTCGEGDVCEADQCVDGGGPGPDADATPDAPETDAAGTTDDADVAGTDGSGAGAEVGPEQPPAFHGGGGGSGGCAGAGGPEGALAWVLALLLGLAAATRRRVI